jgi:branched-chain amino acid aminotransferase
MINMEIRLELTASPKEKPADETALGFGRLFTDHMLLIDYDEGEGWHDARIIPYAPIPLDPASLCLHYAQEVFEGLKAYKTVGGEIRLFRPDRNMSRLNDSCERLCIPRIDEAFFLEAIKRLVRVDRDWTPSAEGASLYIRPFIFAVDPFLGVHPAKHLLFCTILSPVGAYYPSGINPVKIFVERNYVRAVRGGTGYTKAGANYAASLKAQEEAGKAGYVQVLWLDGVERKYIEEVGAMNVFFIIGDEIVTPELRGSVLSGVTRASVIELLRSFGYDVHERLLSIDELMEAGKNKTLREAFGTGTAAVISPIGELKYGDDVITVNDGRLGGVSQRLYDTLTGIQWGKIPDEFGWTVSIDRLGNI